MKQFNLDEYLKNPDRKIVTRDGHAVRILCTDKKGKWPIVALIYKGEEEDLVTYTKDGQKYIPKAEVNLNDLFFAPEKKIGWINIYKIKSTRNPCISPGLQVYNTKEEAEAARGSNTDYISTVKIQWEE